MLVLALPSGAVNELHECLKSGGMVVRPQVLDAQTLAELVPLTRTRYIDAGTTVPLALQDGTIAYPFATLLQAVTDLSGVGGVVLCAPGAYTEPAVTIPANTPVAIVGLGNRSFTVPTATFSNSVFSTSDLASANCSFINALSTTGRIVGDSITVTNLQAGAGISILFNSTVANINISGTVQAYDSTITGTTTLATVELYTCNVSSNPLSCTGNLTARGTTFTNACTVGGAASVRFCGFGLALTVTGSLSTDFASIAPILGSVTAGSIAFGGVVSPKITISVTVPAVAAGQVGYVDVALGATKLAGLVPAGALLVANPTADLVAAGAGGGFINVRTNGANTARFAFLGPLAGGASNFTLGVI